MKAHDINIIQTNYMTHPADIYTLRWQVFADELGIADDLMTDDRDYVCKQVLAVQGKAQEPIGAGRIDLEENGKIGRVAVLKTHRRQGIGTTVIKTLETIARQQKLPQVWCHAQTTAVPFYQRLGYQVQGAEFMEADLPHYKMVKRLG